MLGAQCSLQRAHPGAAILSSQQLGALPTERLWTGRGLHSDREGAADCVLWKGRNSPAHHSAHAERSPVTMMKPLLTCFGNQL